MTETSVIESALIAAAPLIFVFSIFHQAIIELAKSLFGIRTRQYYRAMNYVVYGETAAAALPVRISSSFLTVPYDIQSRERWRTGAVSHLVDSFILRGLGDKDETEITDADIRNVVSVVRESHPGQGAVLELLDLLIRREEDDTEPVRRLLGERRREAGSAGEPDWSRRVGEWIDALPPNQKDDTLPVRLSVWRDRFVHDYLPGEMRARSGLRNALKAAEYRYHHAVAQITLILALFESIAILRLLASESKAVDPTYVAVGVFIASFGALNVVPRGTKSLLDLIMGLGSRIRT